MGLRQIAKKIIQAGMDTGLGQAAINAGSDMLADQWKEYFYCDALPVDVLVAKGQKRIGKKSQNTKGSENIITNGSVIAVNNGQCMIIVDQGQVVEVCAETGEYVYDTSLEPSLFAGDFLGDFKKNVMDFIAATGRRITFGGDVARDQRIYFINTKEILDNKFGTPRPVPFRVSYEDIGRNFTVGLRCFGTYSYKIGNPLEFYEKVCGNVTDKYYRSQIDGQLKTEFLNHLHPAFGKLSQKVRYDELTINTVPITEAMEEVLREPWLMKRGIQIGTVAIESVNISPEDEEHIKKYEDLAWQRDPANAAGIMVGAQAEALTAAASNPNGAVMGFYGMNMAQQVGGINANNLFNMAAQNQAATQLQMAQIESADQLAVCQQTNALSSQSERNTNSILNAIAGQNTLITKEFCDLKERELQNKINTQGDIITQLRNQISNDKQTLQFNAAFHALDDKIDAIAAKQPNTVPVQYPNLVAANATPFVGQGYYPGNYAGWGAGFNGGVVL